MFHRLNPRLVAILLLSGASVFVGPPTRVRAEPKTSDFQSPLAENIRREVERAIAEEKLPGCVVLVGRHGEVLLREAYGHRRLEPTKDPMTVDTVFDLASLTKPIATATSAMTLIERGKLQLEDPVSKHLAAFAANGKETVKIEHLLLHTAG